MNFHVVDEEHNIWYGTAPTDKTALSSAEGHWNFWIDSEQTGIYDIEVNLNTMKWTHTYNAEATASIRFTEVDSDKTSVWYNLQGHRLSTAKNGVLIKSQGDRPCPRDLCKPLGGPDVPQRRYHELMANPKLLDSKGKKWQQAKQIVEHWTVRLSQSL